MADIQTIEKLLGLGMDDMPPSADDIGLMLNLVQARQGFASRADVWRAIGLTPKRGRALLTRDREQFNWPIWYTLRSLYYRP